MNRNFKLNLFFLMLIATTSIFAIASVSTAGEATKLPLAITLDYKNDGNLFLNITNGTDIDRSFVSNLPNILADLFQGFPTQGAFQFKASNGGVVEFLGAQSEGWRSPSLYSSHIDLKKNKALDQLEEVVISAKHTKSYSINFQGVFPVAVTDQKNTGKVTLTQFRIKLPIKVKAANGQQTEITIISDWLPITSEMKNE